MRVLALLHRRTVPSLPFRHLTLCSRGARQRENPQRCLSASLSVEQNYNQQEKHGGHGTRGEHTPPAPWPGTQDSSPHLQESGTDRQTERERREEEAEVSNTTPPAENCCRGKGGSLSASPEKGTCKHSTLRFDRENKYLNIFW